MGLPQKFTFDISFDHVESQSTRRPVERRFTPAELEAARHAALAEGYAAGRDQALIEAAQAAATKTADSLACLARDSATLLAASDETAVATERRAIAALRAIIAKLLPALAARDPLAEIETLARQCLHEAIDEPRIVLRVPPALYDGLREHLAPLAGATGFAGRIVLLADDGIADGDARAEWADGGAERDLARQLQQIDAILACRADPAAVANSFPEEMTNE